MGIIIDRRKNSGGKSTGNRQKFIRRVDGQIKKAIPDVIEKGSIEDLAKGKGGVKVPIKGIKEPKFRYDSEGGDKEYVIPGNDRFQQGDKIPRPKKQGGGSGGSKGSKDGEGQDEFYVTIDREEFLKYFFEDLELPDLVKQDIKQLYDEKYTRKGFTKYSTPSKLNVTRSVRNSLGRRVGVRSVFESKLKKLEEELKNETDQAKIKELKKEIKKTKNQINSIPFLDDVDLSYNNFEYELHPKTRAVMINIMDVSASMGQREKTISKKFFTLLYMFLLQKYDTIDMVFIRHHSEPKEVSEEEFFNSRETGGTVVCTALELANKIISERYTDWNVYIAQCSDGDVWGEQDALDSIKILQLYILKKVQYMAYIEISSIFHMHPDNDKLYDYYHGIQNNNKNLNIQRVRDESEIWPVFKEMFKKKGKNEAV